MIAALVFVLGITGASGLRITIKQVTTEEEVDCYTDSTSWKGKVSRTRGNITCQRWDSQSPHSHTRNNYVYFPDDTLTDAGNFCRDPDGTGAPWCYTMDKNVRWDVCNVPACLHSEFVCGGPDMHLFETDDIFLDGETPADWRTCQSACLRRKTCSQVEVVYNGQGFVVGCKLYGTNILSLQSSRVIPTVTIKKKIRTIYLKANCDIGCYNNDCYHLESNEDVPCKVGSPAIIEDENHLDFFINSFPLTFMIQGMAIGLENITYVNGTSGKPYPIWQDGTFAGNIYLFSDEMKYGEILCVSYGFTLSETNSSATEYGFQIMTRNSSNCRMMDWYICKVNKYKGLQLSDEKPTVMQTAFKCADGNFVNQLAVCNGDTDCFDGTDELNCLQATDDCTGKFQCQDGGCVPYSVYCDFIPDCADGSDEDCEVVNTCKSHERKCRNGQCVKNRFICNGQRECFDGTDECGPHECQDIDAPYQYTSKVSQTISGLTCQAWNTQYPQIHTYSADVNFPDPTIEDAKNYCRSFSGETDIIPWCYTNDTSVRWEFCQISLCGTNATKVPNDTAMKVSRIQEGQNMDHGSYMCQRGSKCLPRSQVCDGKIDCPLADDERLCTEHTCPSLCHCHLYEVTCKNLNSSEDLTVTLSQIPTNLRYLDVSSSNLSKHISIQHLFPYISMLNMSSCEIDSFVLASMPNLLLLDLSKNKFKEFKNGSYNLKRLRVLLLNNNEVSYLVFDVFHSLVDLHVINVSRNAIRKLQRTQKSTLTKLGVFDGSYNKISSVTMDVFTGMNQLHTILLNHNQIATIESNATVALHNLHILQLSSNKIEGWDKDFVTAIKNTQFLMLNNNSLLTLYAYMFRGLTHLSDLSLEANLLQEVEDYAFRGLEQLKTLSIRGNRISKFQKNMFYGLCELQALKADKYKFCCLKPQTVSPAKCEPQANEFSSCENLLRHDAARLLIWVIGILAIFGNCISFLYRQCNARETLQIGYGVFVSNLAISDFLMGIYLMVIAGADAFYHGSYIWNDEAWRYSYICVFAGILSTISSEASVLFICLITIDRILVIKYPYGQFKFGSTSSPLASFFCWSVAFMIALMPELNTDYFGHEFYSVNAVCIALPLTRARPRGWEYSLVVFVFFNFLTFLLVAVGQILILKEIFHPKTSAATLSKRKEDLIVARNLLFIVSTDFMCWCPVGVMGIMALSGCVISGDVYVWASVFILPINAALNPFLYTLSAIIKKQRFSPNVDEQSQVVSLNRRAWETVWKQLQPKDPFCKTLHVVMKERSLTLTEIVHVEAMVAQKLMYLHGVDMYQGNISPEVINIYVQDDILKHVSLQLSPKPTSKDEDKLEDISHLGILGSLLLMHALGAGIEDETADASSACLLKQTENRSTL